MSIGSKKPRPHSDKSDSELSVNQLIEKHSEYVSAVVGKLVSQLRLPPDEYDELLSAGYLGLVESAQRYSPEHNSAFRSYCFLRVRGSVLDHVRKMSAIDHGTYKKLKALDALHELEGQFTGDRLAAKPEDPAAELAQVLDFASSAVLSEQLMDDGDGDPNTIVDRTKSYEEELQDSNTKLALRRAMETLPKKQRSLIEGVYFKDKSFVNMGRLLGRMGKSTVSKLHAKTLQQLKAAYVEELLKLDAIQEGS